MRVILRTVFKCNNYFNSTKLYCTSSLLENGDISRLRNIGILAHIDAGKTTTTERMLYYSGLIKQMGEVHHGNTVTDYMDQERERGITIKSAAVTFMWKQYHFNLIDTPGHIDFTMEVEQTLNVLDGGIVVLDASAGVEAQTLTVWQQADRYNIPRIVFVNKMDRQDADLEFCCESIEKKFKVPVLRLHIPLVETNQFVGVVDILTLQKIIWVTKGKQKEVNKVNLTEADDKKLWDLANSERCNLIDVLSSFDDCLANIIIESGSLDNIKTSDVIPALKNVTLSQKAIPVLCGSAYKNVGIEPLMDAVILYLPSPAERNLHFSCFEDNLCARAFKVIHDKQRRALTFFRIYSGCFMKGQKIYNVQKNTTEQCGKLLVAFADDFREVNELTNGNIAVVTGMKNTFPGDLITNSAKVALITKEKILSLNTPGNKEIVQSLFQETGKVPEPVFFCSIEPPSLASQANLEHALHELQREDSSLRVTYDEETGQIILGGMGELHLEIIKDRILKEYKINAELGRLQIAYREAPFEKVSCDLSTDTKIGNSKQSVSISLSLIPITTIDKGILILDKSPEYASHIANIFHKHLAAIRQGIEVSLMHGPKIGYQVINANIMLHMLEVARGTSESVIAATATQCVQKLLKQSGTYILEPIMYLEIVCQDSHLSLLLADLSRRRAAIQNVTLRGTNKVILTEVPLAELMGYSTIIRTVSSGTATFSMEFLEYRKMSAMDETKAIENVRGF